MEAANAALVQRLGALEGRHSAMASEVQALDSNLRAKSAENESLTATVRALRKTVSVRPWPFPRAAPAPSVLPRGGGQKDRRLAVTRSCRSSARWTLIPRGIVSCRRQNDGTAAVGSRRSGPRAVDSCSMVLTWAAVCP